MELVKINTDGVSQATRPISDFKNFDWQTATRDDCIQFARATGFKETGMSINECAVLWELIERKKPREIVELGRNYGTSTRLFLQYILRHGGNLSSWDYKDWPGFLEIMAENGYRFEPYPGYWRAQMWSGRSFAPDAFCALELAHSIKTPIADEKKVDLLLVDTEHGLTNLIPEYGRWREYLQGGALIAFHDATLPKVARGIEIIIEMEEGDNPGRLVRRYEPEKQDGFGICVLEWRP